MKPKTIKQKIPKQLRTHLIGSVVTFSDGMRYRVTETGAWVRITSKRYDEEGREKMSRGARKRLGKLIEKRVNL